MDLGFGLSEWKKIGLLLTGCGAMFLFLGIVFLLDRAFLTMGNILFLVGIPLVIGPQYTKNFFMQRKRWKGTALFFSGIVLVFAKWTFIGIIVEGFGFINLFGDFVPAAVSFLSSLPLVGPIITRISQLPLLRTVLRREERLPI